MTALTVDRRSVGLDPLRDLTHREARAARELADWLAGLELVPMATRTLDAYEKYGARLLRAFPRHEFRDFTDGDLMHVLKTYPPSSRLQAKAAWNNWFKWGYKTRRIPANPVDLLPDVKYRPKRDYDVFTRPEQDALFALPSPDGELQTILHLAGLRRSEAIGLTQKRIDIGRQRIIVIEGAKGGKERTVPMVFDELPIACDTLETLEGLNPHDHLWATRPGGRSVVRRRDLRGRRTRDRCHGGGSVGAHRGGYIVTAASPSPREFSIAVKRLHDIHQWVTSGIAETLDKPGGAFLLGVESEAIIDALDYIEGYIYNLEDERGS